MSEAGTSIAQRVYDIINQLVLWQLFCHTSFVLMTMWHPDVPAAIMYVTSDKVPLQGTASCPLCALTPRRCSHPSGSGTGTAWICLAGGPLSALHQKVKGHAEQCVTFHNPLKMGLKNGSNICQYQHLLPLLKRGYDPTQDVSWGTGCSVTNTNLETRKYFSERPIKQ